MWIINKIYYKFQKKDEKTIKITSSKISKKLVDKKFLGTGYESKLIMEASQNIYNGMN